MSNNRYGLDTDYLCKRMERMIRDLDNYTPDEAARELSSMADFAKQHEPLSDEDIADILNIDPQWLKMDGLNWSATSLLEFARAIEAKVMGE